MKRIWKEVSVEQAGDGWIVLLDGKPVRTPARREIVVPVEKFATGIAAEWDDQEGDVNPATMPLTRAAATCLDRVAPEYDAVIEMVAAYGDVSLPITMWHSYPN